MGKFDRELEQMLTEDENIELDVSGVGDQRTSLTMFITNKRIIVKVGYIFSSYLTCIDYGNISKVILNKGIITSEIYLKLRPLSVNIRYANKERAEKATILIRNHVNVFGKQKRTSKRK